MQPFYNFENPAKLTSYLRETLIPDLIESGSEATAEDFADCATHIEKLTEVISDFVTAPRKARTHARYQQHGVICCDADTGYNYQCESSARAQHLARKLNRTA